MVFKILISSVLEGTSPSSGNWEQNYNVMHFNNHAFKSCGLCYKNIKPRTNKITQNIKKGKFKQAIFKLRHKYASFTSHVLRR